MAIKKGTAKKKKLLTELEAKAIFQPKDMELALGYEHKDIKGLLCFSEVGKDENGEIQGFRITLDKSQCPNEFKLTPEHIQMANKVMATLVSGIVRAQNGEDDIGSLLINKILEQKKPR